MPFVNFTYYVIIRYNNYILKNKIISVRITTTQSGTISPLKMLTTLVYYFCLLIFSNRLLYDKIYLILHLPMRCSISIDSKRM